MPAPLLRKKKEIETFDPVSAAAWAAGAKATAVVLEFVSLTGDAGSAARVEKATALTPCAALSDARTQPKRQWSFNDYLSAVSVCAALRDAIPAECVPSAIYAQQNAVLALQLFAEAIEAYAKLVRRERSHERLSGQKSARRFAK